MELQVIIMIITLFLIIWIVIKMNDSNIIEGQGEKKGKQKYVNYFNSTEVKKNPNCTPDCIELLNLMTNDKLKFDVITNKDKEKIKKCQKCSYSTLINFYGIENFLKIMALGQKPSSQSEINAIRWLSLQN